ncbi:unnamed protein product, partial [marine sediment metagenome]
LIKKFIKIKNGDFMKKISHINSEGKAKMVDVSTKPITHRVAKARGKI